MDDIAKYSVDIPRVQRNLQFCIFYVECIMLCIFIAMLILCTCVLVCSQVKHSKHHRLSAELGKLLYESNILHITSYFYQEVIYYTNSYILLY